LIERLERGEHPEDVACAMGVGVRTVYKWRRRYREQSLAGLQDFSSRPLNSPARTLETIEARVIERRRGPPWPKQRQGHRPGASSSQVLEANSKLVE
jgi:transposase-like protein